MRPKGKAMQAQKVEPPMPPGFYLMDCMEAMKKFPDKFFDLAVVDPPYGGGGTDCSKFCNVERERERAARRRGGL